jgi:hypothetical protein
MAYLADFNGTYIGIGDGCLVKLYEDEDKFCELIETKTNGDWAGGTFYEMFKRPYDAKEACEVAGLDPDKYFFLFDDEFALNSACKVHFQYKALNAVKDAPYGTTELEKLIEYFSLNARHLMFTNGDTRDLLVNSEEYYKWIYFTHIEVDSDNNFDCAYGPNRWGEYCFIWFDEEEAEEYWEEYEDEE